MVDGGIATMTLREQRVLFTRLLVDLVAWANSQPGWEIAFDEGTVHSPRAVKSEGRRWKAADGVHKSGSYHHSGRAMDLLLYVNGGYIEDGDDPAWRAIAERWESMHPWATSGRRWNDANHLSIFEGKKEGPLP